MNSKMEKNQKLPSMKSSKNKQSTNIPSFQARQALASRSKENFYKEDFMTAKAKSILNTSKKIDCPKVIYELNERIKEEFSLNYESSKLETEVQQIKERKNSKSNKILKTFHFHEKERKDNFQFFEEKKKKHYAINKEREKAKKLFQWIKTRISFLCSRKTIELDDILNYKQTVLNFGLGQIISTVSNRCKQEGELLQYIWDSTFTLFENILSTLAESLNKKDEEMLRNEKELQNIYLTNINFMKEKKETLDKHIEMLYEKMKGIIIWNRTLRHNQHKQTIQNRILNYRICTYSEALEEAVNMLLTQSQQPNCLSLAKKIITKLYKEKVKKKKKVELLEAKEYVHEKAKDFVLSWLKKYTLESESDIMNAVTLSNREKLQILKMTDKQTSNSVDIYDYFKTFSRATQTHPSNHSVQTQYDLVEEKVKMVNTCIGTKLVIMVNELTQAKEEEIQQLMKAELIPQKKINLLKKSNESNGSHVRRNEQRNTTILSKSRMKNNKTMKKNKQYLLGKNKVDGKNDEEEEIFSHQFRLQDNLGDHCNEDSRRENIQNGYNNLSYFQDENDQSLGTIERSDRKRKTINFDDQEDDDEFFRILKLEKKKFSEAYDSKLRDYFFEDKDGFMKTITRRRSFNRKKGMISEKSNSIDDNDKMEMLFRVPNDKGKGEFNTFKNQSDFYIFKLGKKVATPLNICKLKNYQTAKSIFSSISHNLQNIQRNIPKNKQFINLSVGYIIKYMSKTLIQNLKKIKRQKEQTNKDMGVYYPLSVILVDQMINKFGLKEIAEKKLKNFIQKVQIFAGVSDKIYIFQKLLSIGDDKVGADELLVYLKCIVYFDTQKVVQNLSTNKEFSLDWVLTDKQAVLQEMDTIIDEFFPQQISMLVKNKVLKSLQKMKEKQQFEVEKVALVIINTLIKKKKEVYHEYFPIYKLCQNKMMKTLYKLIQMWCSCRKEKNGSKVKDLFSEFYKNSDIIDDKNQRSLTQPKFIGLCFKLKFPFFSQILPQLQKLQQSLFKILQNPTFSPFERLDKLRHLIKIKNIQVNLDGDEEGMFLTWKMAQTIYQLVDNTSKDLVGSLQKISVLSTQVLLQKDQEISQ